jgi:AbrB family looped-hinge helix DNA binding protein
MAHGGGVLRSVRLGPQGRIVIPAELRKVLALQPGDAMVIWAEGDRLVLRPRRAVEEELWEMFRGVEGSLAAELILERREEARRDDVER